jgi:YD repeat-containing protein
MSSRLKHGLIIGIAVIALLFTVEYAGGSIIDYIYDENGNLIEKRIQADTTPPTTTAFPECSKI